VKFGLDPVTDDNVGIISPRAMNLTDPSNANPRMHAFLIFSVKFSGDRALNAVRMSMVF